MGLKCFLRGHDYLSEVMMKDNKHVYIKKICKRCPKVEIEVEENLVQTDLASVLNNSLELIRKE